MSKSHSTEARFLALFSQYFLGAEISGTPGSGFVNLLRMKKRHYKAFERSFHQKMGKAIADAHAAIGQGNAAQPLVERDKLRADIFNKLHSFFSRYFSESGSVYFCNTPKWQPIFERLRAPERDVSLVWKTSGLYYVKSDTLIRSMPVTPEDSDALFYMDASDLPPKQNNERRDFLFEFAGFTKVEGRTAIRLTVNRTANGAKTNCDDIAKQINKKPRVPFKVDEDDVRKAIATFRRQTDADFFIHKDAGKFLREQLNMFLFYYLVGDEGETKFDAVRLAEINALQKIALLVIGFVAEFENELRHVWEKPKFVRGVKFPEDLYSKGKQRRDHGANYVITLDKLPSDLRRKAASHPGAKAQIAEWRDLKLVEPGFTARDIPIEDGGTPAPKGKSKENGKSGHARFLPLDTRHFKNLELEILSVLAAAPGGLDAALDGELVHSENWQALKALQSKYAGRVKCVYIDPPFNLESSDQFDYRTNYKDSCWATMLENRLTLARKFITKDGGIFVRCDYNGNWIVRCLLDDVFGADQFRNEIIVRRGYVPAGNFRQLSTANDFLFMYAADMSAFNMAKNTRPIAEENRRWISLDMPGQRATREKKVRVFFGEEWFPPKGQHWGLAQLRIDELAAQGDIRINPGKKYINTEGEKVSGMPEYRKEPYILLNTNWDDISGYTTHNTFFPTENSEDLLKRVVELISADKGEIVMDFFAGSGTTQAVAQKLGRKWVGVEMGEHFQTVVLPRMKKVLAGVHNGISAEKDVQYKGGGAFKYYALEQYEESLAKTRRQDDPPEHFEDSAYVFHKDEKMTWTVGVKGKKISVLLDKLYPDIDLAETLSHAHGLPIKEKTADKVVLSDGETTKEFSLNVKKMDEEKKAQLLFVLKPYLWW